MHFGSVNSVVCGQDVTLLLALNITLALQFSKTSSPPASFPDSSCYLAERKKKANKVDREKLAIQCCSSTCAVLASTFIWCQARQGSAWISVAMDDSQVQVPGEERMSSWQFANMAE